MLSSTRALEAKVPGVQSNSQLIFDSPRSIQVSMAQRRFRPGQPSPPVSEDHEYLHPEFSKSHGPALPFTPPERFPQQAASQQWQVVGSGTDGGQDYGNPEEYEMAQPVGTPRMIQSTIPLTKRQTFYRDATRFRTPPIPISASPSGIRTRSGRAVGTPASSGGSSRYRLSLRHDQGLRHTCGRHDGVRVP